VPPDEKTTKDGAGVTSFDARQFFAAISGLTGLAILLLVTLRHLPEIREINRILRSRPPSLAGTEAKGRSFFDYESLAAKSGNQFET